MALLVILLLALVATGGLYVALQPRAAQAEAYSQDDVEAGEALFLANCASCHGPAGEGQVDSEGTLGPSLIGSHADQGRAACAPRVAPARRGRSAGRATRPRRTEREPAG